MKSKDDTTFTLTFEEISEMSNMRFKQLVKQKTEEPGLKYLITEKNKQSKIAHLEYFKLEMQEYLLSGNRKKKRYEDVTCVGCGKNVEIEEELL